MKKLYSFFAVALMSASMYAAAVLSVADAITEGMKLDSMGISEADYTVEGFVINAGSFSLLYKRQSWSMADEAGASASDFQAYNCNPIEGGDTLKVLNGDKVAVTGKLKKYYNKSQAKYIIQIERGVASFISKVDGDHSVVVITEEITIAQALEIGATLADNNFTEKQYKLHGFVSAINVKSSDAYSDQYKNQSFWVMDQQGSGKTNAEGAFYVYRGKPENGAEIPVGMEVEFTCTIMKYVPNGGGDPLINNTDQNIVIKVLGLPKVTVKVTPEHSGKVEVVYQDQQQTSAKLTAEPNNGYHFTQWNDGNTDNPRYITLTQDTSFTATFEAEGLNNDVNTTGALVGEFSVSLTKKVRFSKGNLQYQASTDTWRFAENQWDYVGMGYGLTNTSSNYNCYIGGTVQNGDNRDISSTYNGWIDLFGWGTSGWKSGANAYQPWTRSTSDGNYYPGGNDENNLTGDYANADWGVYNKIGNDEQGIWRTLTKDEWTYLFNTRTDASSKYGAAKINGMTGVVLLPDVFTLPVGCDFTAGMTIYRDFEWSYVKTTNIYTLAQWQLMESAGAVFLPASGYRIETELHNLGSRGCYWSSTAYDTDDACSMNFDSDGLSWGSSSRRHYGYAVRLVSGLDDTPQTYTVTFVNYDGIDLQSDEVEIGVVPEYKGETPIKPTDAQYTYTFSGWTPEVVAVTGEATYTATFDATLNTFAITWQDEEGNVIKTDEVAYGETPEYVGETPTKTAVGEVNYQFVGWLPTIKPATRDYFYTTHFKEVVSERVYTVNIKGENCSLRISNELPAGTTLQVEAVADECFEFQKWSDNETANPRTINVTEDADLTAEFNKLQYTITGKSENEGGHVNVIKK